MLPGKRYTDDRDEQDGGKYQVYKSSVQSAAEQPNDIGKQRETAGAAGLGHDLLAEGPQYDGSQFKTLQSPGQADDCNAQYQPTKQVAQGRPEAAEHEPDKIADQIHGKNNVIE